jgi:uncharacterized protein (TIGR00251 family)
MYIKVLVTPNSKRENIEKTGESRYAISVREPAKANLANKRVVELVTAHFGLSAGKVRIITGHHSPSKMLSIDEERDGKI